jgi:hypothetical protein
MERATRLRQRQQEIDMAAAHDREMFAIERERLAMEREALTAASSAPVPTPSPAVAATVAPPVDPTLPMLCARFHSVADARLIKAMEIIATTTDDIHRLEKSRGNPTKLFAAYVMQQRQEGLRDALTAMRAVFCEDTVVTSRTP